MKDIKNAIQWITDLEKAIDHFCDDFPEGCADDCPFFFGGDCLLYALDTKHVRHALKQKQAIERNRDYEIYSTRLSCATLKEMK